MNKGTRKAPSVVGLIIRGAAAFILVICAITFCSMLVNDVKLEYEQTPKSEQIDRCEWRYQNQEFGELYDLLSENGLNDPDFDVYWEAVEGVRTLTDYRQWHGAAASGVEGADEKAAHYLQVLQEQADHPVSPRNAHLLRRLLDEAAALSAEQ